jgi:peptidoglycan/xylan/chitin deacetylase (PgdA/CDA1 family)
MLVLSLVRSDHRKSGKQPRVPSATYLRFLVRALRLLGCRLATVSEALDAPFGRFACLTIDVADRDVYDRIFPVLDAVGAPATLFVPTRAMARPALSPLVVPRPMMGWKHVRRLVEARWEIGTIGHELANLTEKGYADQRHLVAKAKSLIATRLGITPRLFAYPFGAYDASTVSCLRDEGFHGGITLRRGLNDGSTDPFQLRRVPLTGQLASDLALIVRTLFSSSPSAASGVATPSVVREPERHVVESTASL